MKLNYRILVSIFSLIACVSTLHAETAAELLNKAAAKLSSAKSIDAQFKINGSQTGSLKISGKKFVVTAFGNTSWYNGKDMYTYNSSSKETSLFIPTKEELAETNPLYYVSGAKGNYDISFSGNSSGDLKTILLTPKSKKESVKKVEIVLSQKKLLPESLKIYLKSNNTTTIKITKLTLGGAISANSFEYPKNQYKNIKVIDLR